MSPKKKPYALIACVVVFLLAALEFGLSQYRGSLGCVLIVNEGAEPIENLRLSMKSQVAYVGRIEPGASAKVYLSGSGKNELKVDYQQRGSALNGFVVSGFEPEELTREGFQLVLQIRPNEFVRYQDDVEPSMLAKVGSHIKNWAAKSLESESP